MNKEKQIDEMHELSETIYMSGYGLYRVDCLDIAEQIQEQGYRKASEVAEEIFEEIEHTARAAIILLKFEKDEKLRNAKTECYTDLIGYIAELKKKYTEGER